MDETFSIRFQDSRDRELNECGGLIAVLGQRRTGAGPERGQAQVLIGRKIQYGDFSRGLY